MSDNKSNLIVVAVGMLFVVLLIALIFPYELGIKKPHFKPGDCVTEFDEFGDANTSYEILAVGPTSYKLEIYVGKRPLLTHTHRFWLSDDYGSVVKCSSIK